MTPEKPWVSFCMSTYNRPELLNQQLNSLSQQTFTNFEVIISDNDPAGSAGDVVQEMKDPRFKYFNNEVNLGMMKSFNKSIERSLAPYIVMITDDDPIENEFLADIYEIYVKNPLCGMYAGFLRKKRPPNGIEHLNKDIFAAEILNIDKTPNILWSSCVIEKIVAIKIGKIPDFGSPHLADHAFIAMCGSIKGAMIINKMYGKFTSHNANFSKSNLDSYIKGCAGFYSVLTNYFKHHPGFPGIQKAINIHLRYWLLTGIFSLKKYYLNKNEDGKMNAAIRECSRELLKLHFMRKFRASFYLRSMIFYLKKTMGLYPVKSI